MVWRTGVVDTDPAVETFAEEKTQSSIHVAVQCCLLQTQENSSLWVLRKKRYLVVDFEVRVSAHATR